MLARIVLLLNIVLILFISTTVFAQKPELVLQTVNSTEVWNVLFSPDGRLLAARGFGSTVNLIDVPTGRELRSLIDPDSSMILSVAFSNDGLLLATGNGNNSIKLWDVITGRQLHSLSITTAMGANPIYTVAFSPNGRLLAASARATSTDDRLIKIWEVSTGRNIHTLDGSALTLSFSPDGRQLVGMGLDYQLRTWDVSTGHLQSTIKWMDSPVDVALNASKSGTASPASYGLGIPIMRFDANGRLLISSTNFDGKISIWSADAESMTLFLAGQPDGVSGLAFSPDGGLLASGGGNMHRPEIGRSDNTIRLWDTASGRELRKLTGHIGTVTSVAFSPDGRLLVSGSLDGNIKFWNVETGQEVRTIASLTTSQEVKTIASLTTSSNSIKFSQDGTRLISGFRNIWDITKGLGLRTVNHPIDPNESGIMTSDGRLLALGNETITIWDITTGRQLYTLGKPENEIRAMPMAFSSDGRLLASIYYSTVDQVKAVATMKPPRMDPNDPAGSMKVMQEYNRALSARFYPDIVKQVKIWDLSTGQELRSFTAVASNPLNSFSFDQVSNAILSPNGRLVATSAVSSPTIRLWDITTGRELYSLGSGAMSVNSIAFSGDGRLLAATGSMRFDREKNEVDYNTPIKIWDVATGQELQTFNGGSPIINAIALNHDGRLMAEATSDNSIKLWDVQSGRVLLTIPTLVGAGRAVAFSYDGKLLASAGSDGSSHIWNAQTGELLISLISIGDGSDWLAVTPDGLFDGSPAAWNQILWRFENNTFKVAPVEIFFSEFYYPNLLTDVLSSSHPTAPRDISKIDRRQPEVKISVPHEQSKLTSARVINVQVEIREALSEEEQKRLGSGAQDVRLFRNGSLVKVWHGDVLKGRKSVTLEVSIPIIAGENHLTAYAFNHDNVRSRDANLTITGTESLKRAGTLYILTVGIGQYTNSQYDLNYAVADAQDFSTEIKTHQSKINRYQRIEAIPLLNQEAKRSNILEELKKLAEIVQPEDGVIVYFSGHGIAHKDRFYLVPTDIGYTGSRKQLRAEDLQTILSHSISDTDLEQAVRNINVELFLMVIDACNSGQALEAKEKRRGPMNSKGLAQLAYEKGMYILTASQNFELAFESNALKHSYLNFALIEDGLKRMFADNSPKDGQVFLREWLDYAAQRVPRIRLEQIEQAARKKNKSLEEVQIVEQSKVQQPRVFYRREPELQPFVIAKTGASN